MQKIKVAFVINDLLTGGAQRIIGDILENIDKNNFDLVVIYLKEYKSSGRNTFNTYFENLGVRLICVNPLEGKKISKIKLIGNLKKIIKFEKPDILHCMLPDAVIFGTIAGRLAGNKKIIIHEMNTHGFLTWKLKVAFEIVRYFSRLTICYSETLEKEFFPTSHHLSSPITELQFKSCAIFNGVDVNKIERERQKIDRVKVRQSLGINENEIVILCAARLVDWKGHKLLIQAFEKLLKKHDSLKLVLAGDGNLKQEIEKQIGENNDLQKNVLLLGARTDVFPLMLSSDIFSLAIEYPKGVESISIGLSSMESMACGLSSVASDYPDQYAGIENKKNIMLVKPGSLESLSEALEYLIVNEKERKDIGYNAQKYIEEYFSSPKITKIYESVYRTISGKILS